MTMEQAEMIMEPARQIGDLLTDDDPARPLIQASSSGDNATLQKLLSESQNVQLMLQEGDRVTDFYQTRPLTRRLPNNDHALDAAIRNGHTDVVITLLDFAEEHGMRALITKPAFYRTICNGHASVVKILGERHPSVLKENVHGEMALGTALKHRRPEVAIVLLELGADPRRCHTSGRNPNVMAWAARAGSRVVELIDLPIAGTGALHVAASVGHLDSMRILMDRGADVNEVVVDKPPLGFTPMHFAAWQGQIDAMELLESRGGQPDAKDDKGKTPAQWLEEYQAAKS